MPTTLATWLDVESAVESVFATYLGTTLGLPTVKSDSDSIVVTPRIEVVATVTLMGPHQFTIPSGTYANRRVYDQFAVTVAIDLVYNPHWNATQVTTNTAAYLRGNLRACLSDWTNIKAAFVTGGILNVASDSLRQTAGNRTINDPDKEERLTTTVSGVFFLNTNVVPT